jgi:hypothetical protein
MLNGRERCAGVAVGFVLLLLATVMSYSPPTVTEFPPQCASAACAGMVQHAPDGAVVLLYAAGFLLLALGVNGRRFASLKFVGGELVAEPRMAAAAKAAEMVLAAPRVRAEVVAPAPEPAVDEEPTTTATRTVRIAGIELSVTPPSGLPLKILRAALDGLESADLPVPRSLDELEFAARRTGKGNNRWFLKFYGVADVISVSMGGQSNPNPTVKLVPLT